MNDPFSQINPERFGSVNNRKDVGRYPRAEMEKLFGMYLKCSTIEFNWEQESLQYERARKAIEQSIKSYNDLLNI